MPRSTSVAMYHALRWFSAVEKTFEKGPSTQTIESLVRHGWLESVTSQVLTAKGEAELASLSPEALSSDEAQGHGPIE
jgi:hypothetical protein